MTGGGAGGVTDLHSHLVPGVDDGARDLEEALDGLRRMVGDGARAVVTTPHLDGSLTLDPPRLRERLAEVDRAWDELVRAAGEAVPGLDLRRGHEVALDTPDVDLGDPRLRLAGTSFALVEWPRLQIPPSTAGVVARLRGEGVRPVIAHPERYWGIEGQLELAGEWRRAGAYLQVNFGSVVGRWGRRARKVALQLLERGWVDYLASDFHGRPELQTYIAEAGMFLEEQEGGEHWLLLARTNPARLLRGDEPLPVPPLQPRLGVWERVRSLLLGGSGS